MQPPRRVAFDSGHLCERGTDVALWDYADLNESLLGNQSIICCPATAPMTCLDRFRSRFDVILYRSIQSLESQLADVDVYYRIAHGAFDPNWPLPVRAGTSSAVHAVFTAHEPHGNTYAAVSEFVAQRCIPDTYVPVVPHVVRLPESSGRDFRAELSIPEHATVFGRHGGRDSFDLPFAQEAVRRVAREREDAWFFFVNTKPFDDHPRVIFHPPILEPSDKAPFIDACDAMLHARAMGESFGLACAEFSIRNKPVITWFCGRDRYHIDVLRDHGIYYTGLDDLVETLRDFSRHDGQYDAYSSRFNSEAVMSRFADVFLEPTAAAINSA